MLKYLNQDILLIHTDRSIPFKINKTFLEDNYLPVILQIYNDSFSQHMQNIFSENIDAKNIRINGQYFRLGSLIRSIFKRRYLVAFVCNRNKRIIKLILMSIIFLFPSKIKAIIFSKTDYKILSITYALSLFYIIPLRFFKEIVMKMLIIIMLLVLTFIHTIKKLKLSSI